MYHLLMLGPGQKWGATQDTLPAGRVFEHTERELSAKFMPRGNFNIGKIASIPAILTSEAFGDSAAVAHIARIHNVRISGQDAIVEYSLEPNLPRLTNLGLKEIADTLGIEPFEFHRTHWAIKDVDLFKALYGHQFKSQPVPRVFRVNEKWGVEPKTLSVMMPFAESFKNVFKVVKMTSKRLGMNCLRADDIWEDPAVIQDIFSLIYRSRIVVCDCTRRNANVFYETGLAHTLGREVILITQRKRDIPFDLLHLRYVEYRNDPKGRAALAERLALWIGNILENRDTD